MQRQVSFEKRENVVYVFDVKDQFYVRKWQDAVLVGQTLSISVSDPMGQSLVAYAMRISVVWIVHPSHL